MTATHEKIAGRNPDYEIIDNMTMTSAGGSEAAVRRFLAQRLNFRPTKRILRTSAVDKGVERGSVRESRNIVVTCHVGIVEPGSRP